jgi:hypothetical protein
MATPDDASNIPNETVHSRFGFPGDTEPRPDAELASQDHAPLSPELDHSLSLRVRPYSLTDLPSLIRFPRMLRLDMPDSLVMRRSGYVDLASALPVVRRDRPVFVADADGQLVGFVRFSPRRPDGRWIVSAIATSTGVYSPEPVWQELLRHGVWAAGLRGVRRLFARVPEGHPLVRLMHQEGWISYARERIFLAERPIEKSRYSRKLRLQEPADAWAVHQLYTATVPRLVQEAEALTSHFWHMDKGKMSRRSSHQVGWLMEENGALTAYIRYAKGSRSGLLEFLVHPGDRQHFGELLDGVASEAAGPRTGRTYCAVRGYLTDLAPELLERGFSPMGEQELLIRYTTATARTAPHESVHFPVELRPAMPRRVPTFLEGQATDGAV